MWHTGFDSVNLACALADVNKVLGLGRFYWTANPKAIHPGFGFGETDGGIHWKALPPLTIEWGDVLPMENLEVGAVEEICGTYYAILGLYSA